MFVEGFGVYERLKHCKVRQLKNSPSSRLNLKYGIVQQDVSVVAYHVVQFTLYLQPDNSKVMCQFCKMLSIAGHIFSSTQQTKFCKAMRPPLQHTHCTTTVQPGKNQSTATNIPHSNCCSYCAPSLRPVRRLKARGPVKLPSSRPPSATPIPSQGPSCCARPA